jgi:hypothetical protein
MGTASIPPQRPLVRDYSVFNDRVARAEVIRGLVGAQTYSYANDLRLGPCDSVWWGNRYGVNGIQLVSDRQFRNWTSGGTAVGIFSEDETKLYLARFYVPPPQTRAVQLKVYVYAHYTATAEMNLDFINDRTGVTTRVAVTPAALGSPGAGVVASLTLTVPAVGAENFSVYGSWVSGSDSEPVYIDGITATWDTFDGVVDGVTANDSWAAISQSFVAVNGAMSSVVLKWLQRRYLLLASHRPRPVLAKWYGGWQDSTTTTRDVTVGIYKVYVSELVTTVSVALLTKKTGSGTASARNAKVYVDGSLAATIAAGSSTSYTWSTTTDVTVTAGWHEIRVDTSITVTSGTCGLKIATISAWEKAVTAAELSLPGSETVPSAFTPDDSRLVISRAPIRMDKDLQGNRVGIAGLVPGLIYLASQRVRHLISDCRYGDTLNDGVSDLDGGDANVTHRSKFMTGPDTTNVQVRALLRHWEFSSAWDSIPHAVESTVAGVGGVSVPHQLVPDDPKSRPGWWAWATSTGGAAVSANTEIEVKVGGLYNALICGTQIEEVPLTEAQLAGL